MNHIYFLALMFLHVEIASMMDASVLPDKLFHGTIPCKALFDFFSCEHGFPLWKSTFLNLGAKITAALDHYRP